MEFFKRAGQTWWTTLQVTVPLSLFAILDMTLEGGETGHVSYGSIASLICSALPLPAVAWLPSSLVPSSAPPLPTIGWPPTACHLLTLPTPELRPPGQLTFARVAMLPQTRTQNAAFPASVSLFALAIQFFQQQRSNCVGIIYHHVVAAIKRYRLPIRQVFQPGVG